MRLIDADALVSKCGGYYVEEGHEDGFIGTLKCLVDMEPTIGDWEPMNPDKLMAWMMLPNGAKPQWNPWMPLAPYGPQDKSLKDHDFYLVRVANRGTPMKAMYHIDSPFGFEPCSGDFDPLQVTGWMELPDSTEPEGTVHCRDCWKRHLDNCPFYEETDTIARDDYYCQEGERDAEKRTHD